MSAFACRYTAVFENQELLADGIIQVKINIKGHQKILLSSNAVLALKLQELHLVEGAAIHLYYTNPEKWTIERIVIANNVVDKNFRKEE